jgi:DNA repair protein RadA/Sms
MDVFINVVGGLKIVEPAVDLGIIATIASSVREVSIKPDTFVFGEIGLSGEVRAVAQSEARLKEAAKIGFKRAVIPAGNALKTANMEGLQIIGIKDVEEFLEAVLN